jgi:hypothetical protein
VWEQLPQIEDGVHHTEVPTHRSTSTWGAQMLLRGKWNVYITCYNEKKDTTGVG